MKSRMRKKLSLKDLLLYVFCLLLAFMGTLSFFRWQTLLLLPALSLAFLLYKAIDKKLQNRRIRKARRMLMLFLQYLCGGMAVGQSLRQLLLQLPQSGFYGQVTERRSKEKFNKVALYVQTQQRGKTYYPLLLDCFRCPEAKALLYAFNLEQQLGEKMLDFLRESFDSARELIILEEEIAATNSRQHFESLIMAILPFFMAPLFADIVQISNAPPRSLVLGQIMRLLAFVLATSAFVLQLSLSAGHSSVLKRKIKPDKLGRFAHSLPKGMGLHKLIAWLPDVLRLYLLKLLRSENPKRIFNRDKASEAQWLQAFLLRLLVRFLFSLLLFALAFAFLHVCLLWAFLLALATALLQVLQLRTKAKELNAQRQEKLALLLSVLARLLKNGIGLNSALISSAEIFSSESSLSELLEQIAIRIRHGESCELLLEAWAESLPPSDAASALYLLAGYNRHGSLEMLKMLEKQIVLCRTEQRQNIRRRLDAKSGALLLPMLMDLVSVMLLGAAPAMQIFSAF